MNPPPEAAASNSPPQRWEWVTLFFLLGGLLIFNLLTYNQYPAVWCDEVLYSEPAVNLVRYHTYTTAAYQFQPPATFPIVNCPLYGMIQPPWMLLFGTSILAIRSLNYFLMCVAAFMTWRALWRFNLVRTAGARLTLVVVLFMGYGISFAYRCSRPDVLGLVCLLALLLSFGVNRPWLRNSCIVFFAAVSAWIGLQVAFYAGFACVTATIILWAMHRSSKPPVETARLKIGFEEVCLLGAGVVVGVGSLLAFMASKGMLRYFLPPVFGIMKGTYYATPVKQSVIAKMTGLIHRAISHNTQDFSNLILMAGIVVLLVSLRKRLSKATKGVVLFCLVLSIGTPAVFEAVGHFAFYYSYLRFVPAVIALFVVYSDLNSSGGTARWWRPLFWITVIGAVLVGLPLRLALVASYAKAVPRDEIQRIITAHVTAQDTVFSEYAAFFEVKQIVPVAYYMYSSSVLYPCGIPGFDLTPEQKQAVSVIVGRPENKATLCNYFGGEWKVVSEPFGDTQQIDRLAKIPLLSRKLLSYAMQPQTERYQLQIYRRVTSAP